jgi:tetratricopeptide (TPR) repeat protein
MSIFRHLLARLFGKAGSSNGGVQTDPAAAGQPRRKKLPRPANVTPMGNSPFVTFTQGSAAVIMDRDAFEYTYGDADGPDPAQRDLDELLPAVTRVCVLSGAMLGGRAMGGDVLLDLDDPTAVRELAGCLQIVEDPQTFNHCACLGGPTIELYAGLELAATIGLQHGKAIRWKHWYHDGQLRDGGRLDRWLIDHGIDPDLLQSIYHRGDNFLLGEEKCSSEDQRQAKELREKARSRAQAGDLTQALADLERAIELHPDPAAFGLRGLVLYHMQRFEESARDCSEAIRRGWRDAEVYFARGVANDTLNHPQGALADFTMAIHLHPEHPGALNGRALVRARLGQMDAALADFREAIRAAPDWYLPYWNRVNLHAMRGDLDGVINDCSIVLRVLDKPVGSAAPAGSAEAGVDPRLLAVACFRRGEAWERKGELVQAREDYEAALQRSPEFANALSALGWMQFRQGRIEEAFADFAELIRISNEGGWGFGQPGAGMQPVTAVLGPMNTAMAYANRAGAWMARGELERAIADIDAALGWEPKAPYLYGMRGQVRGQQGRNDEALADFSEAIRLEPRDPRPYMARARLRAARGDYAGERDDLEAALRLAPDDVSACNLLTWQLATCPDPEFRDGARAVAVGLQAAEKPGWQQPHMLDTLAAAYAENGQFEEAIRTQERALALFPPGTDFTQYQQRLEGYRAGHPHRELAVRDAPPG